MVTLIDNIPAPFPIDPPDASRITVGTPDRAGYTTVAGTAGAVPGAAQMVVVNLNARNYVTTTATPSGAFAIVMYAPPGSTLLVKYEWAGGQRVEAWTRVESTTQRI